LNHTASPDFWDEYNSLPADIQKLADKNYALLKANPHHPSLHFKKVGAFWSVRVRRNHRALAVQGSSGLVWFWIGEHTAYDRLLS
jgi:hypothetical protein